MGGIYDVWVFDCFNEPMQQPCQSNSVLFGNCGSNSVVAFWKHISTLPDWKHHEFAKSADSILAHAVPMLVHADGAEIFRDDEYFIWSWSSGLSCRSLVKDPLLTKFPIAIVAEREMMTPQVGLTIKYKLVEPPLKGFGYSHPLDLCWILLVLFLI